MDKTFWTYFSSYTFFTSLLPYMLNEKFAKNGGNINHFTVESFASGNLLKHANEIP